MTRRIWTKRASPADGHSGRSVRWCPRRTIREENQAPTCAAGRALVLRRADRTPARSSTPQRFEGGPALSQDGLTLLFGAARTNSLGQLDEDHLYRHPCDDRCSRLVRPGTWDRQSTPSASATIRPSCRSTG